jgi:uncharacterized membrane protein
MKTFFKTKFVTIILIFFTILGITGSLLASIETYNSLSVKDYNSSCSINDVVTCSGTLTSPESKMFGFPISYLGILVYGIVLGYAFVNLFIDFPTLVKKISFYLSLGSFTFSLYLMYVSLYQLGNICIYCTASYLAASNISLLLFFQLFKLKNFVYFYIIWHIIVATLLALVYFK